MKLTEDKQKELLKKLKEFWKKQDCEICNNSNWIVDDTIFEIREFHRDSLVIGGPIKPFITMACSKCGNTKFLNAMILKLLEQNK